eukprot:4325-Pyramimonas_sp.AAC.1
MPMPESIRHKESALLATLYHTPFCALPREGWFQLLHWGGPKIPSVVAQSAAALMRAATVHFSVWSSLIPLLSAAADRSLALPELALQRLSP